MYKYKTTEKESNVQGVRLFESSLENITLENKKINEDLSL